MAGPESDISLSVSVSSLRSWWEWACLGRDLWEEHLVFREQARRAGLELRCLLTLVTAQLQHLEHLTLQPGSTTLPPCPPGPPGHP